MFDAWTMHDWVESVGAVLMIMGMIALFSSSVASILIGIWGDHEEASRAVIGMKSGSRVAA
jgi:hypothetical protein